MNFQSLIPIFSITFLFLNLGFPKSNSLVYFLSQIEGLVFWKP